MAERTNKINFALKSVPEYNGDTNKLSNFINSVTTIQNLFATLNPPLDDFDKTIAFLTIKNKITGKALDSIKDLDINDWATLRSHLINTFKDKTKSETIINELLKIQNIKNPYKLLEITKEKFLAFKSKISIEKEDPGTRIVITQFVEKLIVNNFISTVSDPYRNNLATRNPETINDIEILLENDFQYLKGSNQTFKQVQPNLNKPYLNNLPSQTKTFPSQPINFQKKFTPTNQQTFAPRQMYRNAQGIKPTPMSVQTRQTFNKNPDFRFREMNNIDSQEEVDTAENLEPFFNNDDEVEIEQIEDESSFLELGQTNVKEKS